MAPRRLRRLGLDPAHATGAGVEEAVGGADAREDDVAGADGVDLAVQLRLDLAVEEEVGLLERVVVDLRGAARLVVDGEHREQLGAEDPVDQHLHADPAVDDSAVSRPTGRRPRAGSASASASAWGGVPS